jgi:hypothetical protein
LLELILSGLLPTSLGKISLVLPGSLNGLSLSTLAFVLLLKSAGSLSSSK